MSIFVLSDTHFFHDKITTFLRTGYKSGDEMNKDIISKWKAVIKPTDTVFHLGDFAFGDDFGKVEDLVKELPGKVTLLAGNHDTPAKIAIYTKYWKVASYIVDDGFVLSHAPIHQHLLEEASVRSSGVQDRYCIHGHMHTGKIDDTRYFNVNWDAVGEPKILLLDDIKNKLKEMNL